MTALRYCDGDKSAGPDGMTMLLHSGWTMMMEDISDMFRFCHAHGSCERVLMPLVLSPKKGELQNLRVLDLLALWDVYISWYRILWPFDWGKKKEEEVVRPVVSDSRMLLWSG